MGPYPTDLDLAAWTPYELTHTGATPLSDAAISPTIGANQRFEVANIYCTNAAGGDAAIGVRVGFGATTLPAVGGVGALATGIILSHPGVAAGSGTPGLPGRGGYGQQLRITASAFTTTGTFRVNFLGRVVPV